jgi:hypothetical protein
VIDALGVHGFIEWSAQPDFCSEPNKPRIVVRRIAQYFSILGQQQYAYEEFLAVFAGVISAIEQTPPAVPGGNYGVSCTTH